MPTFDFCRARYISLKQTIKLLPIMTEKKFEGQKSVTLSRNMTEHYSLYFNVVPLVFLKDESGKNTINLT